MKKYIYLTAFMVAIMATTLKAQITTTPSLDEVVVVSSRKPKKISEIPGTVWVVDNQKLQQQIRSGVAFKEALAQLVPGLDIGPEGRTNYGQNLRGRSVLVMIDGVSLNSTRGVSRQLEAIDPFNIEKIEVLSGASSIYGGGATGGIINIITKKGTSSTTNKPSFTTEAGVRTGLHGDDDHDAKIAQAISGGNENWNGRIGVAFQKNGGAYNADGNQIFTDITQTDLQYNQSIDVFASTQFKLAKNQNLSINAQYYSSKFDGERGLFLGTNFAGLLNNPALLEMRDGFKSSVDPGTKRANINANYHITNILGGQDLFVQAASRTEKFSFHPFPGQADIPGVLYNGSSVQETNFSALKLVLAKDFHNLNITYGIDADHENFNADQVLFDRTLAFGSGGLENIEYATVERYPGYRVNGLSGFVQTQLKVTNFLSLSAGIRQQKMYVKVNDFVGINPKVAIAYGNGTSADVIKGGENHYDVNLLNAGLVFKITEPQQAWFNYSQGFNLADPGKYYGQGTYTLNGSNWDLGTSTNVASSPLTGIKTNQYEAGYRFRTGIFKAQLAGFYTISDKNLRRNSTFNIEVYDENVRSLGAEGAVDLSLSKGFIAGVSGIYIKNQKKSNGSWYLQDVTTTSPSKINAFIGFSNDEFGLKLQGLHSFDSKDNAGNKLVGYTTFDVLGNVKLPLGRLSLGVQNVMNKDYQTIWSQRSQILYQVLAKKEAFYYAGRGRTYNITYTINY